MDEEMIDLAANDAAMKRFNDGEPLPVMNPADLRIMWEVSQELALQSKGGGAIAAEYLFSRGVDRASLQGEAMVVSMIRQLLLSSLIERGVLDAYREGSSFRHEVFRAAATMPCGREDVAEAAAAKQLRQMPADAAAPIRAELAKEGLDPENPHVDRRFLSWMAEIISKP